MYDLSEIIEIIAELKNKREAEGNDYLPPAFFENATYEGLPKELKRTSTFL